jgi:hypothetical protein
MTNHTMHSKTTLSLAVWPLAFLAIPVWAAQPCGDGPNTPLDIDYLGRCRPAPVSAANKVAVLATLPPEGEVGQLTPAQRAKLNDVVWVLRVYGRENVWEIKCIDVPQAWTGLHGRAVLLISLPALNLLSPAELQALVAHEAGHEYLLGDWLSARAAGDAARLRDLEKLCDKIAVVGLIEVGRRPLDLARAIEKVYSYNCARFGIALNEEHYPTPGQRRQSLMIFARRRTAAPRNISHH